MKFLGMGVPELVIILVVVLLIFGPKNLPKLGSAIGKSVRSLRDGMGAGKEEAAEADSSALEMEEAVTEPAYEVAEEQPVKKRVVKKVVR